jgi:hypothetical protein
MRNLGILLKNRMKFYVRVNFFLTYSIILCFLNILSVINNTYVFIYANHLFNIKNDIKSDKWKIEIIAFLKHVFTKS